MERKFLGLGVVLVLGLDHGVGLCLVHGLGLGISKGNTR
jgi:hypothetical protein